MIQSTKPNYCSRLFVAVTIVWVSVSASNSLLVAQETSAGQEKAQPESPKPDAPKKEQPPKQEPSKQLASQLGLLSGDDQGAVSPEEMETFARLLEMAYRGTTPPESVRMLIAIARGSQMGPGEGWFGPAESRFSGEWLAGLHGLGLSEGIGRQQFRGTPAWFDRLDRNKDDRIQADDLDWSDSNPYVQQSYNVNRFFRRMDPEGNGRITREELMAFFEKVAQGKDNFTSDDLRDVMLAGMSGSFSPGDAPTPDLLVRGLFAGEIGSLNAGPHVGDPAPDFSLKSQDGSQTVRLSERLGSKPIVLVFGNFTCGPFRAMYPAVDDICQRHQEEAEFLSVYVREAHPSDGWHMESNTRVGVQVAQPKSYADRVGVAQQCHALLKHSMPLLVDEINDPVGNSYSGMPARLYVIDREGKVAYKSGRGPFGFKAGEMEQALIMALLEQRQKDAPAAAAGSTPPKSE